MLLGFMTLVSVLVSPLPRLSAVTALPLVLGLVLYGVLTEIILPEIGYDALWWALIVCLALLSLFAPWGMLPAGHQPLWVPGGARLAGALNPNVVAGALVVLFPFAGFRLLSGWPDSWRERSAWLAIWLVLVGAVWVLYLTKSRGAYLAAGASILVMLGLWRPRLLLVLLPLSLLGAGAASAWLGWRTVLDALFTASSTHGLAQRIEIWTRALYLITDSPYTGSGLGCFGPLVAAIYPLFRVPQGTVSHAHNLFLQVGVDLGLPGLAAYLVVLGSALRHGLVARSALGRDRLALLACACVASLAGMSVHGLLDCAVWDNKGAFLPWVVMGLSMALGLLSRIRERMPAKPEVVVDLPSDQG